MQDLILITLLLVVVAGLALRRKPFIPPQTAPSDERTYAAFERAESLFVNGAERAFFRTLHGALPRGFYLHGKTRLEDIIRVKRGITGEARWRLRGRVKSRHVDYLITDGQGVPKLAIELDGASHSKAAVNADALKDGLFKAAGLPLIRVKTGGDFAAAAHKIAAQLTPRP